MLYYLSKNYPKARLIIAYLYFIGACLWILYALYKIGLYWMNNEGSLAWGFAQFFTMIFLPSLLLIPICEWISTQRKKLKTGKNKQ